MSDTPTPRTDKVWGKCFTDEEKLYAMGDLTKQLERELTAVTEQRNKARLQAEHYRDLFYKDTEPYYFSWEQ